MPRWHPPIARGAPAHPRFHRRFAIQAGAVSLIGLGSGQLSRLRAATGAASPPRSVIFIFLSGGLSQIDSFDPKPDAPDGVRGDFQPIETAVPGTWICQHLPKLASRARLWSLVRSLTHSSNDHSASHHIMLTGRTDLPPGFNPNAPQPTDWPSLAAIASAVTPSRNHLPPAVVLPDRIVHNTGRVVPGQFAGIMGPQHDPWFIEASPFDPKAYGAFPTFDFDHQERERTPLRKRFEVPSLTLPEGVGPGRLGQRVALLETIDRQRADLDRDALAGRLDGHRAGAVALLTDPRVRSAFDLDVGATEELQRYGDHSFGWSLLMARRLIDAGVNLVQVNLGNNETWDTHGFIFPHLKDKLFPPTDQALSALLDDLSQSGRLDSTLIIMAGEFGRTPKISALPQFYKLPGRDHWGRVQTVFVAGGGTQGGRVVGSSDRIGGFPATDPQRPENLAATIYHALGLPSTAAWSDDQERPHFLYHGEPIAALY